MSCVSFFFFCLTAGITMSSCLRMLNRRLNCNQLGIDPCKLSTCLDKRIVPRSQAPTGPEWDKYDYLGVETDKHEPVPVVTVRWKLKSDASLLILSGSKIYVLDESTNQSMCVQFLFNVSQQLNPNNEPWTFSLDDVVVEPGHTYSVSVYNLPQSENGISKQITIPGCDDSRIQMAQVCLENGSLWDPEISTAVFVDKEYKTFSVVVEFETSRYSDLYKVSIQSFISKNVSRESRTSLNVTLKLGLSQLSQCELLLTIQPFFVQCKNNCWSPKKEINYCHYYPPRTFLIKSTVGLLVIDGCLAYLLWRACCKAPVNTAPSAAKEQPEGFQVQDRKRVLIIYSPDHPLYKNIVLKLCSFLVTKCGTDVVLDLLDSTRLGVLGSIQWLNWHREQIENSSDKILILCSPGVQAKWKAMCGDKQVFLREDVRSPVGDMLTPALSLMVPHFIRSASFEKYIVAYFDGVCSEEDVPSPFNITVRYKLMKQFEELFFRILDTEKHQPGRVNRIEGLSEDDYHQCPSGRALQEATEGFQAYQLEHPQWFEDELLESAELEVETSDEIYDNPKTFTNLIAYRGMDTIQINQVETQESDFTADETKFSIEPLQAHSSVEFNPLIQFS